MGVRAFYHIIRRLSSTLSCNKTLVINFFIFQSGNFPGLYQHAYAGVQCGRRIQEVEGGKNHMQLIWIQEYFLWAISSDGVGIFKLEWEAKSAIWVNISIAHILGFSSPFLKYTFQFFFWTCSGWVLKDESEVDPTRNPSP